MMTYNNRAGSRACEGAAARRDFAAQSHHWTERYIGLPYEKGGQGPRAFDCWGFFRHVQRAEFGRDIPAVAAPATLLAITRILKDASAAGFGWRPTASPRTGDGAAMAHRLHPTHVGIHVDDVGGGSILHCVDGAGSVLHRADHLDLLRWKIVGLYAYAGHEHERPEAMER